MVDERYLQLREFADNEVVRVQCKCRDRKRTEYLLDRPSQEESQLALGWKGGGDLG